MTKDNILKTDEAGKHYCTYAPNLALDDEGYLYEGGQCCVCGREVERNYNIKLKQND